MNGRDITALGYREGPIVGLALKVAKRLRKRMSQDEALKELKAVLDEPQVYVSDEVVGPLAAALIEEQTRPYFVERDAPAPYQIWGEGLEQGALDQMKNAARLPVAVAGALMPDAHQGYGLPIGGVLATENAVIPYAVGVDIACRMKLSVFDIPAADLKRLNQTLVNALQRETVFGTGGAHKRPLQHDVLDCHWGVCSVTKNAFDKARAQLGTSGSGNHFVEFGIITVEQNDELGTMNDEKNAHDSSFIAHRSSFALPPGQYLALLSHSGSRGAGAMVASFYSKLARTLHPELPPDLSYLAWLDLNTEAGQEYWHAMNLMGQYAHANHELIHQRVARHIGARVLAGVENHHNFAWKEQHGGKELIVHRKGATPAGKDVLGVIPGSMASPGFVVRGKGKPESLDSASHGAGRRMSRTAAREKYRWNHVKPMLEEAGVQLLSAGIDENPCAYKDIHQVMSQQQDLVDIVARFDPKIVRMAEGGEKPED
jgi:tRNA-splicing ligase RtcB